MRLEDFVERWILPGVCLVGALVVFLCLFVWA